MTGTATLVRTVVRQPERHIAVYRVDPPIAWAYGHHESQHVCVSGLVAHKGRPETYVFPCDNPAADPPIADFAELYPGSFHGAIDHARALTAAGYTTLILEEPA